MGAMYGVWCLLVCSLLDDFVFWGGGYTWSETEGLGKFTRCKLGAEAYYPGSKMMMIATDFEQTNNHPRGLCCTMVRGGHGSVGSNSITRKPPHQPQQRIELPRASRVVTLHGPGRVEYAHGVQKSHRGTTE